MTKTLFTSIAEIKDYISADISSDIRTILPYVKQAEKYVVDIIGSALYDDLISVVHHNNDQEKLKDLLVKVRLPLANFAYFLAIAKLNVNVGDTGFTVTVSSSLEPASEWRVKDFRNSVENSGNDALEELIEFLETNKKHYPKWTQSKAYSFQKKFFINNAKEMNDSVYLEIKRIDFLKLKQYIFQTEQSDILPYLGMRFFGKLKAEMFSDKLIDDNLFIVNNFIRPALCYLTFHKQQPNENYRLEGARYLAQLQEYLDSNASKFPDYIISDNYTDPTIAKVSINSATSGLYVM